MVGNCSSLLRGLLGVRLTLLVGIVSRIIIIVQVPGIKFRG